MRGRRLRQIAMETWSETETRKRFLSPGRAKGAGGFQGTDGQVCAHAPQTMKPAGPAAWSRGAEQHPKGRSSDLRLIASVGRPSHSQTNGGGIARALTEYSSGPVPDSHRLPILI